MKSRKPELWPTRELREIMIDSFRGGLWDVREELSIVLVLLPSGVVTVDEALPGRLLSPLMSSGR